MMILFSPAAGPYKVHGMEWRLNHLELGGADDGDGGGVNKKNSKTCTFIGFYVVHFSNA